jgi:hypothetical protein
MRLSVVGADLSGRSHVGLPLLTRRERSVEHAPRTRVASRGRRNESDSTGAIHFAIDPSVVGVAHDASGPHPGAIDPLPTGGA